MASSGRGGGAAEAEFAGRDDAEHVGVGLFAGADEEVEELGAAGGGVGGQLAGGASSSAWRMGVVRMS